MPLSYELYGRPLHSAPVILINHALTGNSTVAGEKGWWKTLVGDGKTIGTENFTVLCFNIPGNGYDGFLIENHQDFTTADVAKIFLQGLEILKIKHLFALVGGSIGDAIGWEMLTQKPGLAEKFVPIATDFKTSDWLFSQCLVQKFLLESDEKPLEKARTHAMLCYRTPESINFRFENRLNDEKNIRQSTDWLNYHGNALRESFRIDSYKLMNHLLMTINADREMLKNISSEIHLVAVDSDLFFPAFEIKKTFETLKETNRINYHEIQSVHGHDAFLMEYGQLNSILKTIL